MREQGAASVGAPPAAPAPAPQPWVPMHERAPDPGTECVVLVRYTLDRPPFATVDKWDVQREDPTGMGGPTLETGEGWNDNDENDVIAWIANPPHPPADWDQRITGGATGGGSGAPAPAPQPLTPFTDAQVHRLWANASLKDAPSFEAFKRMVRLTESAHGITGGATGGKP